ncbi:MAG: carboxypeptidase-like regulatory domain-containing protein [Flavobacterium sp.]
MKFKLTFLLLCITCLSFAQNGTVTGVVSDQDLKGEPLPFANVTIKGTHYGATSDVNGKYAIDIPEGNYTIVFSFLGYQSKEAPLTIKANEKIEINQTIGSGSVTMEDVVVKASVNREKESALLLEQKKAVEIKQSIGAQEMSRKGVSDVEEGLTKITGITKVDSRGIFVRGLEDRYNNLLINDLAAPTNNPFKKIIPLDLFSTDIVGVIDVYKTFNPNIYGDFAGGTFNIATTKSTKEVTKLSIGTGFTTNNSLEDFLISPDADNTAGFFGFNGKDRELPELIQNKRPSNYTFTTPESQKYFKTGFNVTKSKSPLNSSIGILHGERFDLKNDNKFSYFLSLNFDNQYAIKSGPERTLDIADTGFLYINDFKSTEYSYKASSTGLVGLNYLGSRFKLASNTLYINTSDNSIKDQVGSPRKGFDNQLIRTNQLTKSEYLNTQLSGEYALTEGKSQTIKAGVSYAKTKYAQPDRKSFEGGYTADNNMINTSYGGNNFLRQYLEINGDYFFSSMLEYTLKFGKNEKQNALNIGYNGNNSAMQSSYRFISTQTNGGVFSLNAEANSIDTQIQEDLNNGIFSFRESSNASYKVKLAEFVNAGYANLLLKFGEKWEVNGGLRAESTHKETKFRGLGSFDAPFKKRKVDNLYFLPSINVKYAATEKTNVRFAGSKTYTKPVIMESFPLSYINADGTSVQGNALLKNSDNYNGDLKLEIFPSSKEMITLGVFGKYLQNPIERAYIVNATTSTIASYLNSKSANIYGIEAEFILDLERINKNLTNFSFGLNTTVMNSKVKTGPYETQDEDGNATSRESIETHQTRKLQGASNFMVNSDIKYQFDFNKNWSNTISLVYAVFSKRIYAVGTNGQDHTYELPYQQLDFVWGSKLSEHIDLKFSADNILNPERNLEFGNDGKHPILEASQTASGYKKGIGFSLKLGYTF